MIEPKTEAGQKMREAMLLSSAINNKGELDLETVDFDKIAEEQAKLESGALRIPGWDAPRILPPLWEEMDRDERDGSARYFSKALQLMAILSCSIEADGRAWLHLSVSHQKRIPKWAEFAEAKRVFIGEREAYQVMPPKERYVNINHRVLHVFALLDEKQTALPDFTRGTGSL